MVRENLIQNVSDDRETCRMNSITIGIFAEVLRNAEEGVAPDGGQEDRLPDLLKKQRKCRLPLSIVVLWVVICVI
jgi:hypothetical protein